MEDFFIETNGVRLHLVCAGPENGTPLLLLHGFPEYWGGWQRNLPALAQAGFRVIVPDQRGYGQSSIPKAVSAYAMDELVKDTLGVLDHFGLQQCYLAAHDWGAAVAWTLAIQHPQRVRRLAILNVPHPAVMTKFISKSPRQMLKSWYIGFFQIPGLADWLMGLGNFAGAIQLLKASGKADTFSPEELDGYRQAWRASGGLSGMINWYRALLRFRPSMPRDLRLKMPVLILWGKKDVALSYEMAEASLRYCENGRLLAFEDATHWVQHDEAEAITRELSAFFTT
ncbi:MAG: alpha/beta hydrolase [Anaerolineales bacterium]